MKCEECVFYEERPALGNKYGWCGHQSSTVSSEGEACEHYEENDEGYINEVQTRDGKPYIPIASSSGEYLVDDVWGRLDKEG